MWNRLKSIHWKQLKLSLLRAIKENLNGWQANPKLLILITTWMIFFHAMRFLILITAMMNLDFLTLMISDIRPTSWVPVPTVVEYSMESLTLPGKLKLMSIQTLGLQNPWWVLCFAFFISSQESTACAQLSKYLCSAFPTHLACMFLSVSAVSRSVALFLYYIIVYLE